jgi:hypothetical protein
LGGGAAVAIATIDELLNKVDILLVALDFFSHTNVGFERCQIIFFVDLTYDLITPSIFTAFFPALYLFLLFLHENHTSLNPHPLTAPPR